MTKNSTDALYNAVIKYVETHGGKVFVIGGITIERRRTDSEHTYKLAVKITGRPPQPEKGAAP